MDENLEAERHVADTLSQFFSLACQTALTCSPLTENEQHLSGSHLPSESPPELIGAKKAQVSNFNLCFTWPDSFQLKPYTMFFSLRSKTTIHNNQYYDG